jgi:hypothetical protein
VAPDSQHQPDPPGLALLRRQADLVALKVADPTVFPAVATEAMLCGLDYLSLRLLADASNDTPPATLRRMLETVLRDAGQYPSDPLKALSRMARSIAEQIVAGKLTPINGALEIWNLCSHVDAAPPLELSQFIYWASEWADRPEDHDLFDEGIRLAAQDLIDG